MYLVIAKTLMAALVIALGTIATPAQAQMNQQTQGQEASPRNAERLSLPYAAESESESDEEDPDSLAWARVAAEVAGLQEHARRLHLSNAQLPPSAPTALPAPRFDDSDSEWEPGEPANGAGPLVLSAGNFGVLEAWAAAHGVPRLLSLGQTSYLAQISGLTCEQVSAWLHEVNITKGIER